MRALSLTSPSPDRSGMANLTDHDLRQMDPTWQQRQPEETVRGLLARALDDLRQARERLNQNPTNSSRPSGSMEPWRRGDAHKVGVDEAAVSDDEPASEPAPIKSGEDEAGAQAPAAPKSGAAGPAPRGPGKPPGAAGAFSRCHRLAGPRHRCRSQGLACPAFARYSNLTRMGF